MRKSGHSTGSTQCFSGRLKEHICIFGHALQSCQRRSSGGEEEAAAAAAGRGQFRKHPDGMPSPCLKQVYPKYSRQFNYLRLVERIAALFVRFLGVKGNMRLGPTAFRTFIRCAKLPFFLGKEQNSKNILHFFPPQTKNLKHGFLVIFVFFFGERNDSFH